MKERISATIDKKTKQQLSELLKKRRYRNLSHIIEEAIKLICEKEKHDK